MNPDGSELVNITQDNRADDDQWMILPPRSWRTDSLMPPTVMR